MDEYERKALEEAGFRIGTVAEFLGLTEAEERLIELRVRAVKAIRRLREAHGLTQAALAKRVGSSQSRVAKIEAGEPNVSLDLMLRSYFALGGRLADLEGSGATTTRRKRPTRETAAAGKRMPAAKAARR